MPESKPSAMEQIIEALESAEVGLANAKSYGVLPATEQHTVASALDDVRSALSAARAMQEQQAQPWHDEKPDQWTPEIEAAHPMRSGAHDEYATAMEMVGNRRSKGALVELVCWLLQRGSVQEQQAGPTDDERAQARALGLRQAQKLLAFFGGHDCEVTVAGPLPDHPPGLYAWCTEYPEEGAEYLGPTEVDDELAANGIPAVAVAEPLTPERIREIAHRTCSVYQHAGRVRYGFSELHLGEFADRLLGAHGIGSPSAKEDGQHG